MEKHISRQSASLDIQAKEVMYKIKSGDLSETSVIKAELQTTMAMAKKINQDQIRPM